MWTKSSKCLLGLGDSALLMQDLPDEYVDLVVTSPPYDNLRTYNGYSFDFEAIANELKRVLKPGGVIVWVVNDATVKGSETGSSFKQALYFKSIGLNLHDTMIWTKGSSPFPEANRYPNSFEYMFILTKGKPNCFNAIKDKPNKWAGTSNHGTCRQKNGSVKPKTGSKVIPEYGNRLNVWEVPNPGKAGNPHPAVFPLQLALDHVLSWSNPGDVVLDPFLGSGTTADAALSLERKFIGIEISDEYMQIATKRIGA